LEASTGEPVEAEVDSNLAADGGVGTLVLRGKGHDLENPPVIVDANAARLLETFEQGLALFPADVAEDEAAVDAQLFENLAARRLIEAITPRR
jgi:hypothetical protein